MQILEQIDNLLQEAFMARAGRIAKRAGVVAGAGAATAGAAHLYNRYQQAGSVRQAATDAASRAVTHKMVAAGVTGGVLGAGAMSMRRRQ